MQKMLVDQRIESAKAGDRASFDILVGPLLARLRSVLRHLVGAPDEIDDVLQEALLKAWQGMGGFRGEAAFETWLTAITTRAALDHLRARRRWRAEAQVAYANMCLTSDELSGEVVAAASNPEFAFEVREHISYCFACVGRSLPPDDMAALVLRDVMELSAREAANVLGISDSVLRHRLSAARAAMTDRFEGLCALVSKTGICHQCSGLRMLAPEARQGGVFPDLSALADRAAVVRNSKPGSMAGLHSVFWHRTAEIEAEGLGSVVPDDGCVSPN